MTLRSATAELIEERVRAVVEQRSDAEVIALRAEPRWTGGDRQVAGRRVVIAGCPSPLADGPSWRHGRAGHGRTTTSL